MSRIEARLRAALETDRFALVGAGQLGEMALDLWPDSLPRPEFVLDSRKRGKLRHIPIEDLTVHRYDPEITYLLSAFKIPVSEAKSISASLHQPAILTVYDFFEKQFPHTFSNGWRKLDLVQTDLDRIALTRRCYADEMSLVAFDAVVAWRYRRELLDDYPVTPEKDKYNLSLFGRRSCFYDHVYDCGSYDLSLAASLAKAGVTFGSLVAFEPDPRRHAICREAAETSKRHALFGQIDLERKAVCDSDGREAFMANGLFSARLTSADSASAQCIVVETCTLDAYHAARYDARDDSETRVLIKAHVESAEPRVMVGARRLLERTQADVFVNLSHDETSFLDVPRFLESFGRFDLFLRSSSLFGEGLTLFARRRI